jgi:hypothetical protein
MNSALLHYASNHFVLLELRAECSPSTLLASALWHVVCKKPPVTFDCCSRLASSGIIAHVLVKPRASPKEKRRRHASFLSAAKKWQKLMFSATCTKTD